LQYFIYNSVGSIDENALNALSLVVELTKHIKTKSESEAGGEPETGAEFANFFPSFLWVIRDFTLQLVDESGNSFPPKTYLERALTPMQGFSEGVEVKNRIRRMLLAFFPNRDCVTLKRPVEDESKLQTLDNAEWSDFRPEFIEQVKILRRKIYTSAPPKMLNGKVLDGFMISHLADQYAQSINSGASLNIGDAWTQVSKSKNMKAVQDAIDAYEAAARALEKSMPLSGAELDVRHADMLKGADKVFRIECMGTGRDVDEFVTEMTDKINKAYMAMKETNNKLARAAALEAIETSYAQLAAQVEAKKLASFKDFEVERQLVRKAYLDTCPETPAKLEVLSTFMEAKIPLAASVIAAQVHERSEEAMAVKNEEIKKLSNELEVLKKQSAADLEEASTKLKQAEEQLGEVGGRARELKEEVERQRASHSKQLEEETSALKKQLSTVKEDLETELADVTKKAKDAAAKANSESTELATKVALMEQQSKFADAEKARLTQQHADTSAELEKLRVTNKQLDLDLSDARKQASAQADSAKDVEKKLAASAEEVVSVKAALAAAQAAAADKEKSLGDSASQLSAEKEKTAAELAEAKAKIAAAAEAAAKMEKELAASKEEAAGLKKSKEEVEKTLEDYKSSSGDTVCIYMCVCVYHVSVFLHTSVNI
jgi:DNA repair exonuclease SbcCD ATPase subunit